LFKQVNLLNIEKCFDEIVVVKPLLNQNVKLEYLKNIINDEDIIIGDSRDEMDAAEKLNIKGYFVTTGLWDESFAGSISDVFSCYNSVVNYIAGDKEELER
jgi:phosphoglycolate phosphatase-like HAD superfamily hydrolase